MDTGAGALQRCAVAARHQRWLQSQRVLRTVIVPLCGKQAGILSVSGFAQSQSTGLLRVGWRPCADPRLRPASQTVQLCDDAGHDGGKRRRQSRAEHDGDDHDQGRPGTDRIRCDGRVRCAVRPGGTCLQPRLRRFAAPVRCGARGVARFRHGASRQGLAVHAGQRSEPARSSANPDPGRGRSDVE